MEIYYNNDIRLYLSRILIPISYRHLLRKTIPKTQKQPTHLQDMRAVFTQHIVFLEAPPGFEPAGVPKIRLSQVLIYTKYSLFII